MKGYWYDYKKRCAELGIDKEGAKCLFLFAIRMHYGNVEKYHQSDYSLDKLAEIIIKSCIK